MLNLQYVSKDSTGISSVYARESFDRSDVSVKIYSFAGILPGKMEGGLVEHPDERFSRGKKSTVYYNGSLVKTTLEEIIVNTF